jgi:tetratricopeptide (TPR) repeat protein
VVSSVVYAQSCFEIGLEAGKQEYAQGDAQLTAGNYTQSISLYKQAKSTFESTKTGCRNAPAATLDDWIAKCDRAIWTAENANDAANATLSLSRTSVSFDASGGTATITVYTNASSWNTSDEPSWCPVTSKGSSTFAITCKPNTGSAERVSSLYVNAGSKQVKVSIKQEQAEEDPYAKGNKYYNEKNYAEAVKWYRKSAEQGNASGQHDLGYMYYNGYGVTKDYEEAVKWYRKSAEQGDASGQYNLGYMYRNGYGVTKDDTEALKWYRKSAEQGNDSAKTALKRLNIE